MKNERYTIEKINKLYRVFKEVKSENAIGFRGLFEGTKYACTKYCKENKIKLGGKK